MKAFFLQESILTVISKLQNIVPIKPQSPILSCVRVQAVQGQIILSVSDLNLSLTASIPARVEEEGDILLPAKHFFSLIKELVAPETLIETTSHTATIYSGASQFKIAGTSPEGFPHLPTPEENTSTSCPTALLKDMLSKTVFCAGKDENRPIFSSIFLQKDGDKTTITGTDGKRLARAHAGMPFSQNWQGSFILPLKTATEICHLLDAKEELTYLSFIGEKILVQVGPFLLTSRLIAGDYPDVSRIIPERNQNNLKIHKEEFSSLLRQIALFTSIEHPSARFCFSQGNLQLSIASSESGEGLVEMPVNFQGEPIEIGFNPSYFLDILRHVKDETFDFHISDSYSPGLIADSSSAFFVLMPMRLDS